MTRFFPASRLTCLVTVLAAGIASIPAANIANAKGSSSNGGNATSGSPHYVVKPVNVKPVQDKHHKDKDGKRAEKRRKDCGTMIVPTAGCPVSTKNPTTSVPAPPANTGAKGPSPAFTSATISNGVLTSAIFNGKGLTVTSNAPGMLTVSNGTTSVTLPGGSLTLHGALTVSVPAGYQLVTHANGDVTVAISPVLAKAPAGLPSDPGLNLIQNLKPSAQFAGDLAAIPTIGVIGLAMTIPATTVGAATGDVKGALNDVANFVVDATAWATGWF